MSEVIVLQHVAREHLGLIEPALRAQGLAPTYVRTFLGEPVPAEPGDAAALVVMGGPMGVYEQDRYPHLRHELALIERTLRAERPVLGVCLGSQLLAAALGASVTPAPRKEIGWHPLTLTARAASDPLFAGVPASFTGFHWHGDVFTPPAGAVALASSALTSLQAFRHGAAVYGLLFHLELTAEMVAAMVDTFADDLRVEAIDRATILGPARDRLQAQEPIARGVFGRWAELVTAGRR